MDYELIMAFVGLVSVPTLMLVGILRGSAHISALFGILRTWMGAHGQRSPRVPGDSVVRIEGIEVHVSADSTRVHLQALLTEHLWTDTGIYAQPTQTPTWETWVRETRGNISLLTADVRASLDEAMSIDSYGIELLVGDEHLDLKFRLIHQTSKNTANIPGDAVKTLLEAFERCLKAALGSKRTEREEVLFERVQQESHPLWQSRLLRWLFQEHLETDVGKRALTWALEHERVHVRELACAYAPDELAMATWRKLQNDLMTLGTLRARELSNLHEGVPAPFSHQALLETFGPELLWREDIPEEARKALLGAHLEDEANLPGILKRLGSIPHTRRAFFLRELLKRGHELDKDALLQLLENVGFQDSKPLLKHLKRAAIPEAALIEVLEATENIATILTSSLFFKDVGGASALRVLSSKLNLLEGSTHLPTLEEHLRMMRERLGDEVHGGLSLSAEGPQGALSVADAPQGRLTKHDGGEH